MCKQNSRAKSSQEEVVSPDDENLLIYSKPVRFYEILHHRSRSNPLFLRRCLKYKIQEKGKTLSGSAGAVLFNYKDCSNILQKTEVRENCSCPFCYMLCGNLKGLQLHLNSFHDLFEFEYLFSEGNHTVNVSIRLDAFESEDEEGDPEKFELLSFCMKPRKRRQSRGRNMAKRPRVTVLPMDASTSASETGNGNAGNSVATDLAGPSWMNLPAISQSSLDSDASAVVPPAKIRKLSAERSEARSNQLLQKRQFYHSHTFQPMTLEEVMSGQDSEDEVDDEVADFEDRQMLDDFVDVNDIEKRFMHLWNSFVRKQRVVADGHIPWACVAFAKFHKQELLNSSQLASCWRIFMVKLWNLGLLDAVTMNKSNLILEETEDGSNDTNTNNGVDHHSDNTDNTNSVDHDIDLNAKVVKEEDVDEDVNNSKDK